MILAKGYRSLPQIPGLYNFSEDEEVVQGKIHHSVSSFRGLESKKKNGRYTFVAVDTETNEIIGTSMVAEQHGTPEVPNFYFEVGREEKYSTSINTGFIHGTLVLKYDTDGPSEIGGLVLKPSYKGSQVGKQISFVRFLYIAMNRKRFKHKMIAELLPPLNKKGQSPLWEAIGRRFTNMDYWEADALCSKDKEFIFSLFPSGKIYTTFLSANARNAIGKVNKLTEPVFHMLTKIGFRYEQQVDPFDGGPHLIAETDQLVPISKLQQTRLSEHYWDEGKEFPEAGLMAKKQQNEGHFRAMAVEVTVDAQKKVHFKDSQSLEMVMRALDLKIDDEVAFMPYY